LHRDVVVGHRTLLRLRTPRSTVPSIEQGMRMIRAVERGGDKFVLLSKVREFSLAPHPGTVSSPGLRPAIHEAAPRARLNGRLPATRVIMDARVKRGHDAECRAMS